MAKEPKMAKSDHPMNDLSWVHNLNPTELVTLEKEVNEAKQKKREEVLNHLKEQAEIFGFHISSSSPFSSAGPRKKGTRAPSSLPPKYLNPETGETYAKGKTPQWLQDKIDAGESKDSYINDEWLAAKGLK